MKSYAGGSAYSFDGSKQTGLTQYSITDSSCVSQTDHSMTTLSEASEGLESASPSPKKQRIIRNQEINQSLEIRMHEVNIADPDV